MLNSHITLNPTVMLGKPVIRNTRITVELILRQLAQGISVNQMIENYPHLTPADIYAAVEYAAELVEDEKIFSMNTTVAHDPQNYSVAAR